MKKGKKTNKRYPLFSNKRYVGDPEAITNFFGDTKIILEMKANKEHWDLLWEYFQTNGLKKIGEDFVNSFLGPIQAKMHNKADYKEGKAALIDNMRMLSAILYEVFFYCLKKYKHNLPGYMKTITDDKLLQEVKKPDKKSDAAILYTVFFIQTIYGELLENFSIKPFFAFDEETINQDLESFRITYIQVGKNFVKYNYDDVIGFFCYSCIVGGFLFDCKVFRENEHIRNFYTALHKAFFYRKNQNKVEQEAIELHKILLKIFPWLTDIKNILDRLRWENPYINDYGFVAGLPSDEAINEYRRTHNPPPEKLSFYNPKK